MSDTQGQPEGSPDPQRIDQDLIDRILDAAPEDPGRRDHLRALRRDPDAAEALRRSAEPLAHLRSPIDTPDLTDDILARADAKRAFLPSAIRRWVDRGRLATAAGLLLMLSALATAQRFWPGATDLSADPTPVTAIDRALREDAHLTAGVLSRPLAPARAAPPVPAPPLDAPADLGQNLHAWLLSTGTAATRTDTVITYDPTRPLAESLRVFHRAENGTLSAQPLVAPDSADDEHAEPIDLP